MQTEEGEFVQVFRRVSKSYQRREDTAVSYLSFTLDMYRSAYQGLMSLFVSPLSTQICRFFHLNLLRMARRDARSPVLFGSASVSLSFCLPASREIFFLQRNLECLLTIVSESRRRRRRRRSLAGLTTHGKGTFRNTRVGCGFVWHIQLHMYNTYMHIHIHVCIYTRLYTYVCVYSPG